MAGEAYEQCCASYERHNDFFVLRDELTVVRCRQPRLASEQNMTGFGDRVESDRLLSDQPAVDANNDRTLAAEAMEAGYERSEHDEPQDRHKRSRAYLSGDRRGCQPSHKCRGDGTQRDEHRVKRGAV